MISCICKNVSDTEIINLIKQGKNISHMRKELGLGTQCGMCVMHIKEMIKQNYGCSSEDKSDNDKSLEKK